MRNQDQTVKAPSFKSIGAYDVYNQQENKKQSEYSNNKERGTGTSFFLKDEKKLESSKSRFNKTKRLFPEKI